MLSHILLLLSFACVALFYFLLNMRHLRTQRTQRSTMNITSCSSCNLRVLRVPALLSLSLFLFLSSFSYAQSTPVGESTQNIASSQSKLGEATTYCNPLNIDYGYTPIPNFSSWGRHRATADPVIVNYQGDYYLFTTNQWGYWWSNDLSKWNYVSRKFLRPWRKS